MDLKTIVEHARKVGASDIHLEPGLPLALRIHGDLKIEGSPLPAADLQALARQVVGEKRWREFLQRKSFDTAATVSGVRCRVNVLKSLRGVGLAIRVLSGFQPTIERLNLHPDLKKLIRHQHGLVLVSGPTGSGKSSTLASLVHEVNQREARHIVTIESPIEFAFRPRRSYIRQREVGRDTPSFDQALIDALREDPDLLMVGEMREPDTIRLTINAANTGHLVLSTLHSATCAEALARVVSAFAPEIQDGVRSQLADCLIAVVAQRLQYRPELRLRVPECEILIANDAVKNLIRQGNFFKLPAQIETGAQDGMWTFDRYDQWLQRKSEWYRPGSAKDEEAPDTEPREIMEEADEIQIAAPTPRAIRPTPMDDLADQVASSRRDDSSDDDDVIVLEAPDESIEDILRKLEDD
ncbi:MAG: PilT/PilU family type 4a pilus ATPase [Planctomycetota bacterium]